MMTLPPGTPAPARAARILLVEDDPSAATLLRTLLGRIGYEVEAIADGATALRMLEAGTPPDLLLLDWMLPEVSGLEICQRLRQRWDAITLPILMVTAKTDAQSITEAFQAGASDYLTKPFLSAELSARVAAHLRLKQLVEERRRVDEHLMEREKLAALGLLVSGVAHDLNNPLGGIAGSAQLLADGEEDPERLGMLERILSEVKRCNRIVHDLLSYARRRPAERSPVDVEAVLRSTLRLRERHLRSSGLQLRVELAGDLPPIVGGEHQLQQVFLNILINAEHALQQGGRTLTIEARLAPPSTRRDPSLSWVSITFFNDGPPIPTEVLPRIFDPFFTTKGVEEGTGLGLVICQRIVREHGGEIEVESGSDGTTFRILLPAAREAQQAVLV